MGAGMAERSQSVSLGGGRAPKRPVLELSEDEGLVEVPSAPAAAMAVPATATAATTATAMAVPAFDLEPPAAMDNAVSYGDDDDDAEDDMLDLGGMAEADDEDDFEDEPDATYAANEAGDAPGYAAAAPFELSGMQPGEYSSDYEDDVDEIVDPLAGLRGADGGAQYGYGAPGDGSGDDDALDLDGSYAADAGDGRQDDLLSSADRLAAEDRPVGARLGGGRRRPLLGGAAGDAGTGTGTGTGGGSSPGSTLFERMANLSRSTARDDDDDDDDGDGGGPALSIPRFLGRQNNQ